MTTETIAASAALLRQGRTRDAVTLLQGAAKQGDGDALYEMGRWHVFGAPVPRDFCRARELFVAAALTGSHAALTTAAAFIAMGMGGPRDWTAALAMLRNHAANEAHNRQIALIDAMCLGSTGYPALPVVKQLLCPDPLVQHIEALLTADECRHVMTLAEPWLQPSVVADPATGRMIPHPVRTSTGAVLGPLQLDLVLHALNLRIAAMTGSAPEQGEPLAVMRYALGQEYKRHHDCLPGEVNQREETVIAYLNDDFTSGSTEFEELAISIAPRRGSAVHFRNVLSTGEVDHRSTHAGVPVASGEKWICTRWIRRQPFDPWGAYG